MLDQPRRRRRDRHGLPSSSASRTRRCRRHPNSSPSGRRRADRPIEMLEDAVQQFLGIVGIIAGDMAGGIDGIHGQHRHDATFRRFREILIDSSAPSPRPLRRLHAEPCYGRHGLGPRRSRACRVAKPRPCSALWEPAFRVAASLHQPGAEHRSRPALSLVRPTSSIGGTRLDETGASLQSGRCLEELRGAVGIADDLPRLSATVKRPPIRKPSASASSSTANGPRRASIAAADGPFWAIDSECGSTGHRPQRPHAHQPVLGDVGRRQRTPCFLAR